MDKHSVVFAVLLRVLHFCQLLVLDKGEEEQLLAAAHLEEEVVPLGGLGLSRRCLGGV